MFRKSYITTILLAFGIISTPHSLNAFENEVDIDTNTNVMNNEFIINLDKEFQTSNIYHDNSGIFLRASNNKCKDISLQKDLDLKEYTRGKWYIHQQQVTKYLPKSNNYCVTAEYKLKGNNNVDVYNYSNENKVNGNEKSVKLCAKVKGNAKLAVGPCFLPSFFYGPYWVVSFEEGEDGHALVIGGQPNVETKDGLCTSESDTVNGSGLWIFTRKQERVMF